MKLTTIKIRCSDYSIYLPNTVVYKNTFSGYECNLNPRQIWLSLRGLTFTEIFSWSDEIRIWER